MFIMEVREIYYSVRYEKRIVQWVKLAEYN